MKFTKAGTDCKWIKTCQVKVWLGGRRALRNGTHPRSCACRWFDDASFHCVRGGPDSFQKGSLTRDFVIHEIWDTLEVDPAMPNAYVVGRAERVRIHEST